MNRKQRLSLLGIILTGVGGLGTGFSMLGQTATLAYIITLFFAGLGCGASLVAFRKKRSGSPRA